MAKYLVWIGKIQNQHISLVGKKAFDLNELNSPESPVPNGFVVTTEAYELFINKIKDRVDDQLKNLNINNRQSIEQAAARIQKLILNSQLPPQVHQEILQAYESMNKEVHFGGHLQEFDFLKRGEKCPIAVRSSPSSEKKESLEKQEFITFINTKGVEQLKRAMLGCYASVFSTNNIIQRLKDNFYHIHLGNAVIVQEMISGDKSGILLTSFPQKKNTLEINTVWGLSKGLEDFRGDNYLLEKESNRILDITTERQDWGYYCEEKGKLAKRELSGNKALNQKLNASELIMLGKLAENLERRYERILIVSFTFCDEKLWLLNVKLGDFLDKSQTNYTQMEYEDEPREELSSSEQREEWIEVDTPQEITETIEEKTNEEIRKSHVEIPLQGAEDEEQREEDITENEEEPQQEEINEMMEEEVPETQLEEREELHREIEEEYGGREEITEEDEEPQKIWEDEYNEPEKVEEIEESKTEEDEKVEETEEEGKEAEHTDKKIIEYTEQPQENYEEKEHVEEPQQEEINEMIEEEHSKTMEAKEQREEPETIVEVQRPSGANNAIRQLEFEEKLKEQLKRYSNLYPHARNALEDFAGEVKKIFKESL